jgi:AcrR family transcriptional regulator
MIDDSSSYRPRRPVPARRSQEQRTEETRAKLMQAAIGVINEVGYSKTTSLLISQRAAVSRGAFQHQFGTVPNLMLQIVQNLSSELVGQIELETIRFASPVERLRAIALRYWSVYQSPQYRAVLLIWMGASHDQDLIDRVDRLMQSIDLQRDRNWVEIFADQKIPEHELHLFRRSLLAMVRGLAIQTIYSRRPANFEDTLELMVRLWGELTARTHGPGKPVPVVSSQD